MIKGVLSISAKYYQTWCKMINVTINVNKDSKNLELVCIGK